MSLYASEASTARFIILSLFSIISIDFLLALVYNSRE